VQKFEKSSLIAIMPPFIINVRLREYGPAHEKIVRYAVLAATAAEALEAISGGLAFGDRASLSDETLTDDQAAELGLDVGGTRMLE
jgi:hypothetical protein